MAFHIINGKRTWVEPVQEGDARFDVDIHYDENGIGHLDHRAAAGAWDELAEQEAKKS